MAEMKPKMPKRTNWKGIQRKRCKNDGCNKRIRSYAHLGICNKCANKIINDGKKKK